MIIQRLTPLVNNLMHETLFTKSMLQKENESLSILFLGQAKIQLLPEFKKQHKLYPTQKSNGINLFMPTENNGLFGKKRAVCQFIPANHLASFLTQIITDTLHEITLQVFLIG